MGGLQQFVGGGVVQRQGADVQRRLAFAGAAAVDVVERPVDDGEGAQAEEVEFDEADGFDVVFVELGGNRRPRAFAVERREVGEFGRGDDDAACVFADVARQAFEGEADVDDFAHVFVCVVDVLHGVRSEFGLVFAFCALAEGVGQGNAEDGRDGGDEAVHGGIGDAEDAPDVAQHGFGGHGAVGGDLRDALCTVFFRDVFDDFVAAFHAEVHVEVRHGDAFGVQEAFEEEVVGERVEVGDFQGVGDEGAGTRAASGADGDVLVFRPLDEVGDDKEVAGEAHLVDDAEFDVKAGVVGRAFFRARGRVGEEFCETRFEAAFRLLDKVGFDSHPFRQREVGQVVFAEGEFEVATGCDGVAVGKQFRGIMKAFRHFVVTAQVVAAVVVVRAFGVAALPAAADADADVVVVVVVRIHEAGEVGRNRREAEFAGQRLAEFFVFRLARFAVAGDLQVVTAREDALPVCGAGFGSGGVIAAQEAGKVAGKAAGKGDEAAALFGGEAVDVHGDALRVLVVLVGGADEFAEVDEACVILRKKDELVVAAVGIPNGEVAADNGLDARRPRFFVEFERAVEIVAVGERDGFRPLHFGESDDVFDAQDAVGEGVFAVIVQGGVGHEYRVIVMGGKRRGHPAWRQGQCLSRLAGF